jgi:hypothetical protein
MNILRSDTVKVAAAGIVVLVLLSIPMFWARYTIENTLHLNMLKRLDNIAIEPSGLVTTDIEMGDNVHRHSRISMSMRRDEPMRLGLWQYFLDRGPGGRFSHVVSYSHRFDGDSHVSYFDKKAGLFVHQATYKKRMPDDSIELVHSHVYVGPEGISEIPKEQLGRFIEPITQMRRHSGGIIFDRKLRRFFRIHFQDGEVIAGPEIPADDDHNPVQVGWLQKNAQHDPDAFVGLEIHPPRKQLRPDKDDERFGHRAGELHEVNLINLVSEWGPYTLVLDASGRIDLLDKETLEFAGTAGNLFVLDGFYRNDPEPATAENLLGYQAQPIAVVPVGGDWRQPQKAPYTGMCLATVSREGTSGLLTVFDDEGKLIRSASSRLRGDASARQTYFGRPWAPLLTIMKYAMENIHPPLLSLVSYFAGDNIEAVAGHQAMFILPNSFIGMKARDTGEETYTRFFEGVMLIAPGLALAALFAFLINRDAGRIGLSENTRLFWIIAAASFGLVAYITYRLTRPKITLVTCTNCGKPRRPDMPTCHQCSSKWTVPELVPPLWRVLDQ